jgi:nitroreductase
MAMPDDIRESRMSVFEAILARRSVRSYAARKLHRPTINTLLEAAVRAPTAVHEEPWTFVVVRDRATLERLSDRAKPLFVEETMRAQPNRLRHSFTIFTQPNFNIFYDAGTLIVICAKPVGPFAAADCWLAAENLLLAARAMGLGTCVIGSALAALNLPELKEELGIPTEITAIAAIIVGLPRGDTPSTLRKVPQILAWS